MIEVNQLCGQLYLGKQGENLARIVYFEEHALWEKEFGEGKCELLHQRSGDAAPYPVKLEKENGKCCWKITAADTAIVGDGKCELHYIVDDVVVKSKVFKTTVIESLGGDIAEPPEPEKAWVDAVLDAAQKAEDATTHSPMISDNKTWLVWNPDTSAYIDTGIRAEGRPGADGQNGADGEPGQNGVDGKGIESMAYYDTMDDGQVGIYVWYTDGTTEQIWIPGLKGEDGEDGKDGVDGVGIDHIETVWFQEGFTSIDVYLTNGEVTNFTIPDGKTPIKGIDYWTDADKAEIISEITTEDNVNWELINTITVTPDADGSLPQSIIFSEDSEGNPLELDAFYINAVAGATDGSAARVSVTIETDAKKDGLGIIGNMNLSLQDSSTRRFYVQFVKNKEWRYAEASAMSSIVSTLNYPSGNIASTPRQVIPPYSYDKVDTIKKVEVKIIVGTAKTWIAGSTFELYGVRK